MSEALRDPVTEMECATVMEVEEATESAAATTVIKGSSAWTAQTDTSMK